MHAGLGVSKNEIVCIGKDKEGKVLFEDKCSTYTKQFLCDFNPKFVL